MKHTGFLIAILILALTGGEVSGREVRLTTLPPRQDKEEPGTPEKSFRLKLAPQSHLAAKSGNRPRWSPKNGAIPLEEDTDGYRGVLKLGPDGHPTTFRLRGSKGDVVDTLQIDLDGDGKVRRDEVMTGRPGKDSRVSWEFTVRLRFPELKTTLDCPCVILYAPSKDDESRNRVARYAHRGFMQGGGKVPGLGKVEVILVDFNHDGQYTIDADRWALARAGDRETLYAPETGRPLARHNWIEESAFAAFSLTPDGRELIITPTKTELSREEERIRDDPYHADKQERRSGRSVTFLHDFEEARKLAKRKKRILFVDFETTWCGPCKMMDRYVYSADKIVAAARKLVCVKVDGDKRKDLAKRFDVKVYPTLILLDAKGEVLDRRTGYQSVARLREWLTQDR